MTLLLQLYAAVLITSYHFFQTIQQLKNVPMTDIGAKTKCYPAINNIYIYIYVWLVFPIASGGYFQKRPLHNICYILLFGNVCFVVI